MRACSIENCGKAHLAKGLCSAHYQRQYKYGRTTLVVMYGAPVLDRIMAKVHVAENGCWLFTGTLSDHGYGQIRVGRKMRGAHIVTYEMNHGPVPEGKELDHFVCQTPRCCHPDHTEPVTHLVNVRRGNAGRNWVNLDRNERGQFMAKEAASA